MIARRAMLVGAGASLLVPRRAMSRIMRGSAAPGSAGLKINLTQDASWSSAPTFYQNDIITAANMLMAAFPGTNITLTINAGYTTSALLGPAAPSTSSGAYFASPSIPYSTVKAALVAYPSPNSNLSAMVANLPGGTTLAGRTNFSIPWACSKALGLYNFTNGPTGPNDTSQVDGAIVIGSGWSSAKTVGVFLHEISHAMGRVAGQGAAPYQFSRFTAAGVWDTAATAGGYFSVDGGTTSSAVYDSTAGDPGDFANTVTDPGTGLTDAFDAQQSNTPLEVLSSLDIKLMNAMGFQ